jgi:hypothetical protein
MTWNDVPEDCRPVLLRATRDGLLYAELYLLPGVLETVDAIQVPWSEDDDIVEEIFIGVTRRFSKESERDRVKTKSGMNEIFQLLDFCVSRIDQSMLSSIITK